MMDGSYLHASFYFAVSFASEPSNPDASFQEVSGFGPEVETEAVVEGGENRFVHRLSKAVTHPKLVLKRGIAAPSSPLVKWCQEILEGGLVRATKPQLVHVFLLNDQQSCVRAWSFENAYPVQWEIDDLRSTKNEVALEKVELSYTSSKREQ